MTNKCPNCGAPIKRFQKECEYCGNEIDEKGISEDYGLPIIPYGGKIQAEIILPENIVRNFDDKNLELFCKERILSEMAEEIMEHISIRICRKASMDFFDPGHIRVRGILILGENPDKEIFCKINGKSYIFGGKENDNG